MRKPRKLKYPRKPKASASLQTMQNYLQRVKEIDKKNADNEREYKKALQLRERIRRM